MNTQQDGIISEETKWNNAMYLQKLSQQTELINPKGSSYQLPESSSLQTIVDQEITGEEADTEVMASDEERNKGD